MIILALDSTATTASAALCRDSHLLALTTLNGGLTHSETLLPIVEELFNHTGLTVADVDMFAVSAGPGSFTGVRIGAATVKGLAFGRGKPCVGVSSLEALARNLIACEGIICPVMNARREQVYNALFEARDGVLTRLCPDRAIAVDELCRELDGEQRPIYVCGDGAELMSGVRSHPVPDMLIWQNAYSVARCALETYNTSVTSVTNVTVVAGTIESAGHIDTDRTLSPTYLRMPQAERERLERLKEKEMHNNNEHN